ncbi:MAG: rhodanese-like domain-containing protein [Bryobacteraceae bacterium]
MLKPGEPVHLVSDRLAGRDSALLFILSTTCRQCLESQGFHRRILEGLPHESTRTIAVFPQPVEQARAYLQAAGLRVDDIIQANPDRVGAPGSPTLILVDKNGRIRSSWIGRLSAAQEGEVAQTLGIQAAAGGGEETDMITASATAALLKEDPHTPIIDVRDRDDFRNGHLAAALNIPVDELESRARPEIPRDRPVVVFCEYCRTCENKRSAERVRTVCTFSEFQFHSLGYDKIRFVADNLDILGRAGLRVVKATEAQHR